MTPRFKLLCCIAALSILLSLQTISQARAQSAASAPPEPSLGKRATLLIDTDENCTVEVDGLNMGTVMAAKSKTIRIAPGEHIVKASLLSAPVVIWRKVLHIKAGEQTIVLIELKPLDQGRKLALADEMKAAARMALPTSDTSKEAGKSDVPPTLHNGLPVQGTFFAQPRLGEKQEANFWTTELLSFTLKLLGNEGGAIRATILKVHDIESKSKTSPTMVFRTKSTREYKLLLQPSEIDKTYRTVSCQYASSQTNTVIGQTKTSSHTNPTPSQVCKSGSGFEKLDVLDDLHIRTTVPYDDKTLLLVTFVKSF